MMEEPANTEISADEGYPGRVFSEEEGLNGEGQGHLAMDQFPPLNPLHEPESSPRLIPGQAVWKNKLNHNPLPPRKLILRFIPPAIRDEKAVGVCPEGSEAGELRVLDNTLVGFFLGKKPSFSFVKTNLLKQWKIAGFVEVLQLIHGGFAFRFSDISDRDRLLEVGVFYVGGQPMFLRQWERSLHSGLVLGLKKIPLWVTLPGLPLHLWGEEALSVIGSVLGVPLFSDNITAMKNRLLYARICVEFSTAAPLLDMVTIEDDEGNTYFQPVKYEWKPPHCLGCGVFGHNEKDCSTHSGITQKNKHEEQTKEQDGKQGSGLEEEEEEGHVDEINIEAKKRPLEPGRDNSRLQEEWTTVRVRKKKPDGAPMDPKSKQAPNPTEIHSIAENQGGGQPKQVSKAGKRKNSDLNFISPSQNPSFHSSVTNQKGAETAAPKHWSPNPFEELSNLEQQDSQKGVEEPQILTENRPLNGMQNAPNTPTSDPTPITIQPSTSSAGQTPYHQKKLQNRNHEKTKSVKEPGDLVDIWLGGDLSHAQNRNGSKGLGPIAPPTTNQVPNRSLLEQMRAAVRQSNSGKEDKANEYLMFKKASMEGKGRKEKGLFIKDHNGQNQQGMHGANRLNTGTNDSIMMGNQKKDKGMEGQQYSKAGVDKGKSPDCDPSQEMAL